MDTDDVNLPDLSTALVEALEKLFPDCCPDISLTDRQVWFAAGRADVIKYIREQYRRQNETTF
jgi:hypothetical protein